MFSPSNNAALIRLAASLPKGSSDRRVLLHALQKSASSVTVDVRDYSWGRLVVVSKGNSYKAILHPEHQEALLKLQGGQSTQIKDEQGVRWKAFREGNEVTLQAPGKSLTFDLSKME